MTKQTNQTDTDTNDLDHKQDFSFDEIDLSSNNKEKLIQTRSFDFIPQYARDYLFYCINIVNRSQRTVQAYYFDLRTFFRYFMVKFNLTKKSYNDFDSIDASSFSIENLKGISLSDIYEYMNFTRENRDNEARARCRKTSSLKSFYKYLNKNAIIDENITEFLEAPKMPKSLPVYLSLEESIKLLESIDGKNVQRNFAVITLFLNCGLRLSELVGLNLSSIKGDSIRILGKGNKERIVFLNDACKDSLNNYLKVRIVPYDSDKNALFISSRGKRISKRMVQTLVRDYIVKSGLDPTIYSPHKLRHTAATLMYQNGVDIRALQQVLGHENLGTTEIYTHLSDKQIQNAIENNPLNQKIKPKKINDETE